MLVVVVLAICAWPWVTGVITTLIRSTMLHLLTELHRISWLLRESSWGHPHIRHSRLLKYVFHGMGRRHMTLRQSCRLNSDTLWETSSLHHWVRKENVVPWHAIGCSLIESLVVHHRVITVRHCHLLVWWITRGLLLLEMHLLVKRSTASVHVVHLRSHLSRVGLLVLHHARCF